MERREWYGISVPGVALALLFCSVSSAQDKTRVQLLATGQQLQAEGRYAEAEASFQSAFNQAQAS